MATGTLTRPQLEPRPAPGDPAQRHGRHRSHRWLVAHRRALAWFVPVLALTAAIDGINFTGIPQRFDDEGTYVAQAYAAGHLQGLTHYTYIYDHPPLGWLQIAAWFDLTGALSRYSSAVLAGREFMLVTTLVSATLLWLLARRLRLSYPAAAATVALFAVSPLAVQFHRSVYLDNIATPWVLAAFLLALAPRRQLLGYVASGAAFAVAVLTKETSLLFLPFLAWQMWRGAEHSIRRYSLSVAATVFALIASTYALFAVLKGELLPSGGRSSLAHGIFFQLVARNPSGSLADPHSPARATFDQWWGLDPVLMVAAPLAALLCLRIPRFRPLAAALLFLAAFMIRPGYLPVPYVIALIPLGALLVAAVVDVSVRSVIAGSTPVRRWGALVVPVAALTAATVAAPLWNVQLRGLLQADLDRPMADATQWVERNVSRNDRLIVDDAMWLDLVRAGFDQQHVVWYYKVDTDPAVAAQAPNGWRDYDYVVSTSSLRTFPDQFPVVSSAVSHASPVATFGTGKLRVEVLRVDRGGVAASSAREAADQAARTAAGRQLVGSGTLTLGPGVADLISAGRLDSRAAALLSAAPALVGRLTVADLPPVTGENDADLPRRQVLITAVDGQRLPSDPQDLRTLRNYVSSRAPDLAPATVQAAQGGLLVTWPAPTSGTTGVGQ